MNKLRVGFIGLGLMGIPMAKNILRKGFPLTVYNRTRSKTRELKKRGAWIASTSAEVGEVSDIVITMVTDAKSVREVLFGKDGVVKWAKKGLIVVDMSTIGPTSAKEISSLLATKGIDFIDAPVTGSTPKAETGELTIFSGGKQSIYKKILPVLKSMGTTLHYMGPVGMGQAIKIINNHIIAVSIVGVAEGMLLADGLGLSRKKAGEVLKTVPAMSFFMNLKLKNFVSGKYPLFFSVSNMEKDVKLAYDEARKTHKTTPLLQKTVELYKKAMKKGLKDKDMSTIIKILESPKSSQII